MQESGYNRIKMENMQLIVTPKFVYNLEHVEGIKYFKEDWITGTTNYRSPNPINHTEGASHKKSLFCF